MTIRYLHEDPRRVTCRIERPYTRQRLSACAQPIEDNACVKWDAYTHLA